MFIGQYLKQENDRRTTHGVLVARGKAPNSNRAEADVIAWLGKLDESVRHGVLLARITFDPYLQNVIEEGNETIL